MATIEILKGASVEVDPAVMAKVFWSMSDAEQADFLGHLARTIKDESPHAYGLGEMQWCYLHGELQKRYAAGDKEPLQMYLALAGFAFEFARDIGRLHQKPEPYYPS